MNSMHRLIVIALCACFYLLLIESPCPTLAVQGSPQVASGFGGAGSPEANLFVGGLSTSIPIDVPPGRGLTPTLALSYNSALGPSLYGHGWDLPLGSIRRRTRAGLLHCQDEDEWNEFVLVLPGSVVEFRRDEARGVPHQRPQPMRIDYVASSNSWIVTSADGTRYSFGADEDARSGYGVSGLLSHNHCEGRAVSTGAGTFVWSLSSIRDQSGNSVSIGYAKEANLSRPIQITYGANDNPDDQLDDLFSVAFDWADRPLVDRPGSSATGVYTQITKRLQGLRIAYQGNVLRSYSFHYDGDDGIPARMGVRSFLVEVLQWSGDFGQGGTALARETGEAASTVFVYQENRPEDGFFGIDDSMEILNLPIAPASAFDSDGRKHVLSALIDVDGDGFLDILDSGPVHEGDPDNCSDTSGTGNWHWYRGGPNGFDQEPELFPVPLPVACTLSVEIAQGAYLHTLSKLIDLTGDGVLDLVNGVTYYPAIIHSNGLLGLRFNSLATGHAYPYVSTSTAGVNRHGIIGTAETHGYLDINGDGYIDFVDTTQYGGNTWAVYLHKRRHPGFPHLYPLEHNPRAFEVYHPDISFLGPGGALLVATVDINGDGLVDQVETGIQGPTLTGFRVHLHTGTRISPSAHVWIAEGIQGAGIAIAQAGVSIRGVIDIDGDGLPDLLDRGACTFSNPYMDVYLNTGQGFSGPYLWRASTWSGCALAWSDEQSVLGVLVDLDGDAYPDHVSFLIGAMSRNSSGAQCASMDSESCISEFGLADTSAPRPGAARANALRALETPLGSRSEIHHRPISDWDPDYVPVRLWTVTRIESDDGMSRTVGGSDSGTADGQRTVRTYEYMNPYFDAIDREFRGFGRAVVTTTIPVDQEALEVVEVADFHQDRHRKGRQSYGAHLSRSAGSDFEVLREIAFEWQCADPDTGGVLDCESHEQRWVRQASVQTTDHGEESSRTRSTRVEAWARCDGDGDFTGMAAAVSRGEDSAVATRSHSLSEYICVDSPDSFGIHVRRVAAFDDGNLSTPLLERWFFYDSRGRIKRVEDWLDVATEGEEGWPCTVDAGRQCAIRQRIYDAHGNVAAAIEPNGSWTYYFYDAATRIYPELMRSESGYRIRSEFDPACGVVQSRAMTHVGPGAALSKFSWSYDEFCRVEAFSTPDQNPGEIFQRYEYLLGAPGVGPGARISYTYGPEDTVLQSTVIVDAFGRVVQMADERVVDGVRSSFAAGRQFDHLGNVVSESVPFSVVSLLEYSMVPGGVGSLEFTYDGLGRVTKQKNVDGTWREFDYGTPWVAELRNECYTSPGTGCLGGRRIEIRDGLGRTVETRHYEIGAGEDKLLSRTGFEYDGIDRVRARVQGDGSGWNLATRIQYEYDSLGRMVRRSEPDSGEWKYFYDIAGNLIVEDDPKSNQYVQYCYDSEQRPIRKYIVGSDFLGTPLLCDGSFVDAGVVEYAYDADTTSSGDGVEVENGVGRLVAVVSENASIRIRAFDSMGRPTVVWRSVNQDGTLRWAEFGYSYDSHGRLATLRYPDGEEVRYSYDVTGQVAGLTSVSSGHTYLWEAAYDQFGRKVSYEFGNNTSEVAIFSPNAADGYRLQNTSVRLGSSFNYLSWSYTGYTSLGQISEIEDDVYGLNSNLSAGGTFAYDGLGRLITADTAQFASQEYEYDIWGNITRKGSVELIYGSSSRPHRFTEAVTNTGPLLWASYDGNGNRVNGLGVSLSYDREDRLVSASTSGSGTVQYAYDAAGMQVLRFDGIEHSVRFGDLAEFVTTGTGGTLRKHYYVDGRRIATRKVNWQPGYEMASLDGAATAEIDGLFADLVASAGAHARASAAAVGLVVAFGGIGLIFHGGPGRRWVSVGVRVTSGRAILLALIWLNGSTQVLVVSLTPRAVLAGGGGGGGGGGPSPAPDELIYYHADYRGSTQLVTSATGAIVQQIRYGPYGEVLGPHSDPLNRNFGYEFTGYESDRVSGLQYAQARWYDPAVGMFLTHDPEGEFHSPYLYTGGDPINRTDPTGRSVFRVYGNLCDMPGEDCSSVRRPGGAGGGGGVFIGGTRDINTGCPVGMVPYGFGQCLPPAQIELIERAQRDREESARRDAERRPGGEVGSAPPAASPASEDPARPAAAAPEPSHGESVRDTIIEAAPDVVLAQFIPLYGELLDLSVMFGGGYSWTDRGLASVSFLGGVVSGGAGPNIGPVLRARARAARGGRRAPDFVVSPGGTAYPVPRGATGPVPVVNNAGNRTGTAFTGGRGGANGQVDTVRIMDPTAPRGGSPGYPNGYIKYENAAGQGVNPYTGRTGSRAGTHVPLDTIR